MMRHLLLAAFLALSALSFVPATDAAPGGPSGCNDVMSGSTCPGGVCVYPTPTSAGPCTKHQDVVHACTADHAPCGPFDVACVYSAAVSMPVCVTFECACNPMSTVQAPALPTGAACTGCLPWICIEGVNAAACYGADGPHDVCIGFSLQVPFCKDVPCKHGECFTIDCANARPVCDPTNPCGWGYFECYPCACVPMQSDIGAPVPPGPCANCVPQACATEANCGDADACVTYRAVATCVDIPWPCQEPEWGCIPIQSTVTVPHAPTSSAPACANCIPPLVGVCYDQTGNHGCYGHHDVCISFSYEVPFCTDLPTTTTCGGCLPQACAAKDPCESDMVCASYRGAEYCLDVPLPCDGEYTECTCDPSICNIGAASQSPTIGPLVGACVKHVTNDAGCSGGHDACVYGFSWVPVCADLPCQDLSCVSVPSPCDGKILQCTCDPRICNVSAGETPQSTHAQCNVLVGSGAAAAACTVNGKTYGPVRTCDTCTVLFYEACTVGTDAFRCWSG